MFVKCKSRSLPANIRKITLIKKDRLISMSLKLRKYKSKISYGYLVTELEKLQDNKDNRIIKY